MSEDDARAGTRDASAGEAVRERQQRFARAREGIDAIDDRILELLVERAEHGAELERCDARQRALAQRRQQVLVQVLPNLLESGRSPAGRVVLDPAGRGVPECPGHRQAQRQLLLAAHFGRVDVGGQRGTRGLCGRGHYQPPFLSGPAAVGPGCGVCGAVRGWTCCLACTCGDAGR